MKEQICGSMFLPISENRVVVLFLCIGIPLILQAWWYIVAPGNDTKTRSKIDSCPLQKHTFTEQVIIYRQIEIGNALKRLYYLTGFVPEHIVDIGASQGFWSRQIHEIFPNASFTLVEGNSDLLPALEDLHLGRVIHTLVAETRKTVTYYKNHRAHTGNSIFREATPFFSDSNADTVNVTEHTQTIDDFCSHLQVDLLKLDIQGAEKLALQGATKTLRNVHVLTLEMSLLPYNLGAPLAMEVLSFLYNTGFEMIDVVEMHQLGVQLNQIDFIFVNKNSCVWEEWIKQSNLERQSDG